MHLSYPDYLCIHNVACHALVDRHSARHRAVLEVREFGHIIVLLSVIAANLPAHDMGFQPLAEVGRAHAGVDDGEDD